MHIFIVKSLHEDVCDVSQCVWQFDGCHVRCLLSMPSITSPGSIANRFWQDTGEKHYSHNNRGERSLCGVVFTKLTRPFTAFWCRAGCLAQWKAYQCAHVVWKAQMSTLFTTAPGRAGGIIDWLTFCLEPNIHPGGIAERWKSIFCYSSVYLKDVISRLRSHVDYRFRLINSEVGCCFPPKKS